MPIAPNEDWQIHADKPPLGPHQQQEMRQRVIQEAAASCWRQSENLVATVQGLDRDSARALFFAELRSLLTATATS
jgi:hypothetical protein